jgi:hypothetical protein
MKSEELELLSYLIDTHSLEGVLSSLAEVTFNKASDLSDYDLRDQSKIMSTKGLLIQDLLTKVSKL